MFQAGKRGRRANGRFQRRTRARRGLALATKGIMARRRAAATSGQELKFHDVDVDQGTVGQSGDIAQVSVLTIAQGTTESTRIGRKVVVRKIGWKMAYTLPETDAAATPVTGDIMRVILYQDRQTNGATATVTGILESADFQSFNQLANKSRFRTLMDRTYTINYAGLASDGAGVVSQGNVIQEDSFYKNVNIPIEYDNSFTTGVIGTMRSNNIGVLTISQGGIVSFQSKMRIRFSDG